MIPPFDYLDHRRACRTKQAERLDRIANLPVQYKSPLSNNERTILGKPIDELVQDVKKQVTSPIDVLRAYGKVAIKAQQKTNCLTEIMLPEAETWATRDVNLKGPLAGIPVSLKDSIAVAGFDVSVGYSCNTSKPYAKDGSMIRLLKDAGAVPFVKTNLPVTLLSFESFNAVWGRCLNPHNPRYSPGGSTGGEGALLAFGGSRIGIGSDVAGSVRAPAHFSGCYSLRCSTGRWPKVGMNTSMPGQEGVPSVFSPMARTLHDLMYFTKSLILMKPWEYDYTVHPIPWRTEVEDRYLSESTTTRLRIGVLRTDGVVPPSPACTRAFELTVSALEAQGHEIIDVIPPANATPYMALVLASRLLNSDGCRTFRSFFRTGEADDDGARAIRRYMHLPRLIKYLHFLYVRYIKRDEIWAGLIQGWHPRSTFEQWKLVAQRELFRATWYDWWKDPSNDFDVILCPPNATPAVPHRGMGQAVSSCGYTFLWNLLDYTAGIVPVTKVDREQDGLVDGRIEGKRIRELNGVARGAYAKGHYDVDDMHGLPVAVQVVGKRLEEEKVLAIMRRVEEALREQGTVYKLLDGAKECE
ncbi:MAG: hypothetical protein M1820_010183 [Bogoriella megaspora]|nr:MAG: hypothetical protein M1820_010183 [Bogoriella megaspora]